MTGLLDILAEFLVMLESRARRYGLDLTDVDMILNVEPRHDGWHVYAFAPNHLVRIR